jgi:DMSO/TMAO reductase YedYZ molybdopterin-dependent catalytic subunit
LFIVHGQHPLNGESPITTLANNVVTRNVDFYVRNHFQIPTVDPSTWRLRVVGLVNRPQTLTLRDLHKLRSQTRVVTLECAGNGRAGLDPPTVGVPWTLGAVSTAEWTGVPLVEVLDQAGVRSAAREVIFRGADSGKASGHAKTICYERALTLNDAKAPEVLLAYAMNGETLSIQHGYPLRLIVPGWYGMAAVKWLSEIRIADQAFGGHYQVNSYYYEWSRDGKVVREPVTLQRVRSLITKPLTGERVNVGELVISGLAWSGAAPIARVEVSINGRPWQNGHLHDPLDHYCWQRWELITSIERGTATIRARATDLAGHTQPYRGDWNRLGYGNNAIQQVTVLVR